MQELLGILNSLKTEDVSNIVRDRVNDFTRFRRGPSKEIFNELCFCILTANCSAEKCIEVQNTIGDKFHDSSEAELARELKRCGYRFPNIRAKFIVEARELQEEIYLNIRKPFNQPDLRKWIAKNVRGLGYKETSHFLRNIGFTQYAIIDFHIIDVLVKFNLIERPKTLTPKKYLEIEGILNNLAKHVNLNLAELDLYLWYLETGKILK
ncbi:MAG: N-glycosylase/DNA lyase [Promethearchaeota archaeon]|jgi:N-glycosylase/DNA lyase